MGDLLAAWTYDLGGWIPTRVPRGGSRTPVVPTTTLRGPGRIGDRDPLSHGDHQLVVRAVSSTTKLVWSEESSTPLNLRATVEPAKDDRLKDFWTYPVAALRFE